MKIPDIKLAEDLVYEHLDIIKRKWDEVHGN